MNTADDLLKRTLRYLQKTDSLNVLAEDIEKYLGQPKDEPETDFGMIDEPVAFSFDRYVDGKLMAEGVIIEREKNLKDAIRSALRVCSRSDGVTVLVLRGE